MITKFKIFEKISISDDVKYISEMLLKDISEKPNQLIFIYEDIEVLKKFKIKKIEFERTDDENVLSSVGAFYTGLSTKNPDGSFNLLIKIKKTLPPSQDQKRLLYSLIYHEVQHMVDYVIKKSKNVKDPAINSRNLEYNNKYSNFKRMIYMAYDTEMKSRLHEVYVSFKYYLEKNNIKNPDNNDIRKFVKEVDEGRKVFWVCQKYMIEYDIFKDTPLNDDFDLKKLAEYINTVIENKIKLEPFDKDYVKNRLIKIQNFIRKQGLIYKKKAYKILQSIVNEYNEKV